MSVQQKSTIPLVIQIQSALYQVVMEEQEICGTGILSVMDDRSYRKYLKKVQSTRGLVKWFMPYSRLVVGGKLILISYRNG